MKVSSTGLEVEVDFPADPYEEIHAKAHKAFGRDTLYIEFAGAWNAVPYRFQAAAQCDLELKASLQQHGAGQEPTQRLAQERAIFEFFGSAVSAVESVFYALYAIGAWLAPQSFTYLAEARPQ